MVMQKLEDGLFIEIQGMGERDMVLVLSIRGRLYRYLVLAGVRKL